MRGPRRGAMIIYILRASNACSAHASMDVTLSVCGQCLWGDGYWEIFTVALGLFALLYAPTAAPARMQLSRKTSARVIIPYNYCNDPSCAQRGVVGIRKRTRDMSCACEYVRFGQSFIRRSLNRRPIIRVGLERRPFSRIILHRFRPIMPGQLHFFPLLPSSEARLCVDSTKSIISLIVASTVDVL